MGWLEDAQKKAKELSVEKKDTIGSETFFKVGSETDRELLKKELGKMYENATSREIDKAIDYGIEKLGLSFNKSEFFKVVRIKLED